jgi:polar amino acid transport system substrate-binding protein
MFKIRSLVLLSVLLASLVAPAAMAQDLPDLGGRTVTVAVENAYPPFNNLNEDGEPEGWDYDVVNEICARLNCVPEFIQASWEGMIAAVANGEYDMAGDGITITEERAQIVDFSKGYARIIQRLMVRIDEERFASLDEFVAGDYQLGVQVATTNELTANTLLGGNERITTYLEFGGAVQGLIAGDVDAVIIDDIAGMGFQGENEDDVRLLPDIIKADERLGFIFGLDSELTAAFDAALESMIADGMLNYYNGWWHMEPYQAE